MHRELDTERERMHQFATPILNRRMRLQKESTINLSETPGSAPDSVQGLGNMHFIRSVLEHHRNGGNTEDVEEFYQQLEAKDENSSTPMDHTPGEQS